MTKDESRPAARPWWGTWLGAVLFGVVALLLLSPSLLAALVAATLPTQESAGVDFEVAQASPVTRVLGWVFVVVMLGLPVATVRWARQVWAGYLLLGLSLSGAVGFVGLFLIGVL